LARGAGINTTTPLRRIRLIRWSRYRRAARAILVFFLLADAAVAFIALPNSADLGLLASAVDKGRVVVISAAPRSPTIGPVPLWSVPENGVEWSDSDGRRWLTRSGGGVDGLAQLLPAFGPGRGLLPLPNAMLESANEGDPLGVVRGALDLIAGICWLVMLAVLLFGPAPRKATRWGWLWLFALPLSIGGLWWLLRESPWTGDPLGRAVAEPATGRFGGLARRDGRLGGLPALAMAAASGAVGTAVLGAIPAMTPAVRGVLLVLLVGAGSAIAALARRRLRRMAPG
jgi:hypothetical protein